MIYGLVRVFSRSPQSCGGMFAVFLWVRHTAVAAWRVAVPGRRLPGGGGSVCVSRSSWCPPDRIMSELHAQPFVRVLVVEFFLGKGKPVGLEVGHQDCRSSIQILHEERLSLQVGMVFSG